MRVLITGGSGFVGRHITPLLIANGHTVHALARSDESAAKLEKMGATVIRGGLTDLELLEKSAAEVDAVIHTAFNHEEFAKPSPSFALPVEMDGKALRALAKGLKSGGIFINTSGTTTRAPGQLYTEENVEPSPQRPDHVQEFLDQGLNAFCVRLSPITHGYGWGGFLPIYAGIVKKLGYAPYVGEGHHRFSSCHVADAAEIYVKVLEKAGELKGHFYHGVGEGEVTTKQFAEATAKALGVQTKSITPDEVPTLLGFIGILFVNDCPCSNKITKEKLDWTPKGQTLAEDIAEHIK